MKIDLGNFGQSTIEVAPQARTEVIGEAVQQTGAQIGDVARKLAEQRFQQQAATAANNLLDHQLQNQKDVQSVQDRLASGDLAPEQAPAEYQRLAQANPLPRVDNLTPEAASAYSRGAQRVQAEGGFKVDALADVARKHRFQDQFTNGLDTLGKLAGSPGTSAEQTQALIEQGKSFGPVGRASGLPPEQVDKAIQDFTDQTWLNHAVQRAIENHDNMAGLQTLQKDLSEKGGFYDGKLDTNKRNAVEAQVGNRIDTILARLQHEADRREADGLRAMNEIERQISTGVQAPTEAWANWAQRTSGTSSASDFADSLGQEQHVQEVLRLPVDQQLSYVQTEQARMDSQGATVKEQTNLFRLGRAVQNNVNQMQQAPLIWMHNRIGKSVEPLDISTLLSPDGAKALQDQVSQRVLDLQTMQKQYGPQIKMRPLLPQEADQLGSIVASTSPDRAAAVFAGLRQIATTDEAYAGMMKQIAPDHPVLALAGLRAMQDPQVATYIVQGESLLNPTKEEKAADGKPSVSLYLPEDKAFQQAFSDAVGTAFREHDAAAETSYQAVKAYYAGKAKHDGIILPASNEPDAKLLKESIAKVVGTVVDYNGKGDVVAPWGMDKSTFYNRVDNAWAVAEKRFGLADMSSAQRSQLGLINTDQEGVYLVPAGNGYLTVVKGKQALPVVIDLNDPEAVHPSRGEFGTANPLVNPVSGQPY